MGASNAGQGSRASPAFFWWKRAVLRQNDKNAAAGLGGKRLLRTEGGPMERAPIVFVLTSLLGSDKITTSKLGREGLL